MALERQAKCKIIRGEDKRIVIQLFTDPQDGGRPEVYNLSNATDFKVYFMNADRSALIKDKASGDVVLVNAGNGLEARIRTAESRVLALGDNQAVEAHVVDNGNLLIAQIPNALTVIDSLFPAE